MGRRSRAAWSSGRGWCVVAVAVLGLAAGCKAKPEKVTLSRLLIDAPPAYDAAERSREELRAALEQRLAADPTVAGFARRPDATHRLRLRIHDVIEAEGGKERVRPVEIELTPLDRGSTFRVIGRGGVDEDLVVAGLQAFDEGWPVMTRMRTLEVQGDDALIAALEDPDPRIRGFAIDRLGERGAGDAVPALIERLEQEEELALVLRAVGALVSIGHESAVEPLIDLTWKRDPTFVLQIVFAVSAIGGRTAEGFLVTLATGHSHPAIQKGAKDALEEMRRRAAASTGG